MATATPTSSALAIRRPLHIIDAELSELKGQITEIKAQLAELTQEYSRLRKAAATGPAAGPVALVRPPAPLVAERATTTADRRVKTADSWEAIDIWVKQKINELKIDVLRELPGEVASTAIVGPLLATEDLPFGLPGGLQCYERMHSSGYNQDCLMHSFLNALSPIFRRLVMTRKNEIANYFRVRVVVDLYNELIAREGDQSKEKTRMIKELLAPGGNLDIAIGNSLGIKYKIGILLKDISTPITNWVIVGFSKREVKDYTLDDKYIMFYNPGQGHFEAIRSKCTGEYIFDRTEISGWEAIAEDQGLHGGEQMCKIGGAAVKLGDIIEYDDDRYSVIGIENTSDNTSCKHINVVKYNRSQTRAELDRIDTEFKKRIRDKRDFKDLKIYNIASLVDECTVLGNVDDHKAGVNYSRGGRRTRKRR
jgi:hypothetical protein